MTDRVNCAWCESPIYLSTTPGWEGWWVHARGGSPQCNSIIIVGGRVTPAHDVPRMATPDYTIEESP